MATIKGVLHKEGVVARDDVTEEKVREEIGRLEAKRDRRCAELVRGEVFEKTNERLNTMKDLHKKGIDIIHRRMEALHERLTLVKETINHSAMGHRMGILGGVL